MRTPGWCRFKETGNHSPSTIRMLGEGNQFEVKPGVWCLDCGWLKPLAEGKPGPSKLAKRFL